jgi:hypothetical protein
MGLVEAILEGSFLVREVKEKAASEGIAQGRKEGKAAGLKEGRIEEARHLLRTALRTKFPGLEAMPEIDAIKSLKRIEALLVQELLSTDSPTRMERAIRAAARR